MGTIPFTRRTALPRGRLAAALLALWLGFVADAAWGQAPLPGAVDVASVIGELPLGRSLQILEDPQSRFDLHGLQAEPHAWATTADDALNFGFSRSTWWLRMAVRNGGAHAAPVVLDLGSPLQDWIDVYLVRDGGAAVEAIFTGDRRPFDSRQVPTRVPSVPIALAPGEQIEVYVRLATHDGLHEALPLKLWQRPAYVRHEQTETLALGLYYGALIAVLLYNLFLFASTRERSFGLYVAYLFAFLVWSFAFRGFAFQYGWPDSPTFGNRILPVAASCCYITFSRFIQAYLGTRRHSPRWLHRTLVFSTWGCGLCIVPGVFDFYAVSFAASVPFGVLLMVASQWAGWLMLRAGSRPARYFIIAFTLLAMSVVLYYLRIMGVMTSNTVTENALQIGSALEVLLLAFGLADQMNTLKADKLRIERDALAAQTALTNDLERQVDLRTAALEEANARLADMAITDEMTGAFNRRHFTAAFEAAVARHARQQAPLAFCLIDIDHFKLYNDRYGHAAGDAVLKRLSQAVRGLLSRAGDQFFRVGGEEFGILLNMDEAQHSAPLFVEQIREAVQALGIEHLDNAHGVVTASFGLVMLSQDAQAMRHADLYAAADRLLYEAKHAGRNRVVTLVL